MATSKNKFLLGFVPVLHAGYFQAFDNHPEATIGVFDQALLRNEDYIRKDIRALPPEQVVKLLVDSGRKAEVITEARLSEIISGKNLIKFLDDDISHSIVAKFDIKNATYEPVFLRWHRQNINTETDVKPDKTIRSDDLDFSIEKLFSEAYKSTDWWRHIGAGMIVDGELKVSHNHSLPHQYVNSMVGDPRITAKRGISIDTSVFIHAEAALISEMAKNGMSTDGQAIFMTTFPCPTCAKLVANAGFKKLYFIDGYATLDGYEILKSTGVEIIKIETNDQPTDEHSIAKEYPEKPSR